MAVGKGSVIRRAQIMINMRHSIEDTDKVVDRGCLDVHFHGSVRVEARLIGGPWIDFKEIKRSLIESLKQVADVDTDGTYDFGLRDSEQIVKEIGVTICGKMERTVEIMIQETPKYGVTQLFKWE